MPLSLSLSLSRLANSIFHLCLHGRPFIFWFVFWLLRALRAQVFTNELLSCLLHFFAGPQVFPAPVFVFSRFSLGRQPHQMTRVSCASGCFRACWLQNVSIEWPDFEVRSHHMPAAMQTRLICMRLKLKGGVAFKSPKKKGSHALEILKSS